RSHEGKVSEVKGSEVVKPESTATYYGYYGVLDKDDGSPKVKEEKLDLQFWPRFRVTAVGSGDDATITWKYQGFQNGREMVLTYFTERRDAAAGPAPTGVGSFALQLGEGGYSGTAIYWSCSRQAMYRCPYVLSQTKLDISGAKNKWPKLLGRVCVP